MEVQDNIELDRNGTIVIVTNMGELEVELWS